MTYSPELLAAVAVLDKDQPGWWRKVDLGTFALVNDRCVLAQVYGGVGSGSEMVACVNRLKSKRCAEINAMVFADLDMFQSAWASLISERQEADQFTLSTPIEVEGVVFA